MSSLKTLAVANYRSIRSLVAPLGDLTFVTGANGSGKSNLYRALRLLSEAAQGGIVASLAKKSGLASKLWAGPEQISRRMKSGEIPIQGGPRTQVDASRLMAALATLRYDQSAQRVGRTKIEDQGMLDAPAWRWPER
jgi:predicted ATPase